MVFDMVREEDIFHRNEKVFLDYRCPISKVSMTAHAAFFYIGDKHPVHFDHSHFQRNIW